MKESKEKTGSFIMNGDMRRKGPCYIGGPLKVPEKERIGCNCPEIFKGPHGCTSCGDKSYLNNNEE